MDDGRTARRGLLLDWIGRIDRQAGDHPRPWYVTLELTERCNLRCVHCYVNRPAGDDEVRQNEMTLVEWQRILDQVAEAGTLWLLVTGGEPLLRSDFPQWYLYAKRRGLHVVFFTNGTLLTPELADLLAEYPPWETEITLYGATAQTYEQITGVPGSYARCRQGIDLLLERGLALNLKTMALTLNVHELPAMQRLADILGVSFRYDPAIQSRLEGHRGPLAFRLSPEQIVALECQDPKRVQEWQELCGLSGLPVAQNNLFKCGAGLNTIHVDPYGVLYPCLMTRWLHYDLRVGTVEAAVRDFMPAVRRMTLTHDDTCRRCDLSVLCLNCPAWAQREVGDPEASELFHCRLAHLRQQGLGLNVQPVTMAENRKGEE